MQPRGEEIEAATLTALAESAAVAFGVDPDDVWARLTLVTPGTTYAGGGLIKNRSSPSRATRGDGPGSAT